MSERMIVCNEIDKGLWQAGVEWLPPELPEVDVILHAVPLPADMWLLARHPPTNQAPRIFLPFADHNGPMNEALWDSLRAVTGANAGRRVLTVCSQGKNRSGLMSALVLIARGWGVEEAIERVQARGSNPGSVQALGNDAFRALLRSVPPVPLPPDPLLPYC